MKLYLTLLLAEAKARPGRLMPGMLAMCISVALIVWMMGNFDALVSEFDDEANAYMGSYSLCVAPSPASGARGADIAPSLVEKLRNDPAVEVLDPVRQIKVPIGKDRKGKSFDDSLIERMGIPSQSPVLAASQAENCPYELVEGRWPDMKLEKDAVGVLGSASAEFFKVKVGDSLFVRDGARVAKVQIVGIVHQSQAHPDISSSLKQGAGPAFASLFVPSALYESVTGTAFVPNLLNIGLKEGVNADEFRARWQDDPAFASAVFVDTDSIQKRMADNRSVRNMKDNASSAAGMVLFACFFIIFTTLSMGVAERVRMLALLRALGLRKRQIALLTIGESLLLSLPAFLFGCLAGLALLLWTMPAGWSGALPMPSWTTVLVAFGCSAGGALLAAIIPAWRATRTKPLDASAGQWDQAATASAHKPWLMAVLGLLCWAVQPCVLFAPGLSPDMRKTLFVWLGYPGLLAGTLLLAPGVVVLVERFLYRPLAGVMRLNPVFLQAQLSSNMLRSSGTAIALTVGLGLYMAVQIWGYSMVVPFVIDRTMPNTLVSFLHTEFKGDKIVDVMNQAPLNEVGMHPIAVEEPDISQKQLDSPAFHSIEQKSVVVAGIPLHAMMERDDASFRPKFVKGDRGEALKMMKEGRALLIPDTFVQATGLEPGDVLELVSPSGGKSVQEWKVAGVVSMPGWHWLTKTSGMRVKRGHFIAALVIADRDQARSAFGIDSYRFFWGDSKEDVPAGELQKQLQAYLLSGETNPLLKPLVKVTRSDELGARVQDRADATIESMSKLPMIALLIASLALMNTVLSSVNARKHEFKLLHAVGVTKGGLFSMVLSESLLIGAVAIALSFLFGLISAWGSIEILKYGYVFGGVTPPVTIPWLHLFYGVCIALGLCMIPVVFVRFNKLENI